MHDIIKTGKKRIDILIRLLLILSLVTPFLILYSLYQESFEMTWKGRTYYLFFLWLFSVETILSWEECKIKKGELKSIRTVVLAVVLFLPTIYVVATSYFGSNKIIADLARQQSVPLADWMPLSTEYLVLAVLFASIILLTYGTKGLGKYPISAFFLGVIGLIYTIDNLYPFGTFTPFQFLVPTTTRLAASLLNLMGYQTSVSLTAGNSYVPLLTAQNSKGAATFGIAWPCSGIESLIIYTVTILLFLKDSPISWKYRTTYFVIGAIVTYFINALRIASIFVIQINEGDWARMRFHDYYGQLYSITWIISYPLIILGGWALWERIRNRRICMTTRPSESRQFRNRRH